MFAMFLILVIVVCGSVVFLLMNDTSNDYYKEELEKYNLVGNIKTSIGNASAGGRFIYSNDKKLFYANDKNQKFDEIKIKDILEIEIEVKCKYKGKQKIISLTPQATIRGVETAIIFRIITEDKIYSTLTSPEKKSKATQLKAILEREMEGVV